MKFKSDSQRRAAFASMNRFSIDSAIKIAMKPVKKILFRTKPEDTELVIQVKDIPDWDERAKKALENFDENKFALYRVPDDPMIVRSTDNPQVNMIVPEEYKHLDIMKELPDEWYSDLKTATFKTGGNGGTYYPVIDVDHVRNEFISKNRNLIGKGKWNEHTLGEHWDKLYRAHKERVNKDRPYIDIAHDAPPGVVKHEVVHHVENQTLDEGGENLPETVHGLGKGWGYASHFDSKLKHFDAAGYAAALMHLKNPTYTELEIYESGNVPTADVSGIKQDFGKMLDVRSPGVREKYVKLVKGEK